MGEPAPAAGPDPAAFVEGLEVSVAALQASSAVLHVLEPGDRLRPLASSGLDSATLAELEPALAAAQARALSTRARVLVPDVRDWMEEQESYLRAGIRALQVSLLVSGAGDVVGLFSAHWAEPREFSPRDLRLLDLVCGLAAGMAAAIQAEQELRAREALQAFLVRLGDRLRPISDPIEIQDVTTQLLREHLGASRVLFVEWQEGAPDFAIGRESRAPGVLSLVGRFPNHRFGTHHAAQILLGRTVVLPDVLEDPGFTKAELEAYETVQVRSLVTVPLVKEGALVSLMAVHSAPPRSWTPGEIRLVEETCERTWAAVERARAEAALHASEGKYRLLATATHDGVSMTDLAGRITYANQALCAMLGYSETEMLGSSFFDHLSSEEDLEAIRGRMADCWGDGISRRDLRLRRKDGTTFWAMGSATALRDADGACCGTLGLLTDISRRKELETHLAFQGHILECVQDAIVVADGSFTITYWNRKAEDLFGWTQEETLGRPGPDFLRIVEATDSREDRLERLDREGLYSGEVAYLRKDGSVVHAHALSYARKDADGNLAEFVTSYRDVSARRLADEALRQANARLAEADRRKNEFLAMLGHELRNPLAAISSALNVLDLPQASPAAVVRAREIANRQAGHMKRLVDDLLEVSRITRGKVSLQMGRQSMADLAGAAVEAARPSIEAAGHRLSVSMPDEDLHVRGDSVRLAQVVGNLLNNASKYTPRGGDIHLAVERHGDEVALRVRDTGIGIPPDLKPRIFDLFVQGKQGAEPGLGIGLTMVRSLVESHGGRVEVRSEGPDQGSEFIAWLPLYPDLAPVGAWERSGAT